jgi:hypothetical protein
MIEIFFSNSSFFYIVITERWSPYSEYLTSFVDSNLDQGFEEITDILKRYWTLRTSNETLMSQVQQVKIKNN